MFSRRPWQGLAAVPSLETAAIYSIVDFLNPRTLFSFILYCNFSAWFFDANFKNVYKFFLVERFGSCLLLLSNNFLQKLLKLF